MEMLQACPTVAVYIYTHLAFIIERGFRSLPRISPERSAMLLVLPQGFADIDGFAPVPQCVTGQLRGIIAGQIPNMHH